MTRGGSWTGRYSSWRCSSAAMPHVRWGVISILSGCALPLASRENTGSQFCRSEEHTSELQSPCNLVCRLLLEKKKNKNRDIQDLRVAGTLRHAQSLLPSAPQVHVYIHTKGCAEELMLKRDAIDFSTISTKTYG